MLAQMDKNPGTRPSKEDGGTMREPPSGVSTLASLGIDKKQSSNWNREVL